MSFYPIRALSVILCFAAWHAQAEFPPFSSVKTAAGSRPNSGNAIALDGSGNFYVAGSFGSFGQIGSINFGTTNLVSQGDTDGFVAKFDAQGQCLWARQMAGVDENDAYDVIVRSDDSILVIGEFLGTNAIGSSNVVSHGGYDVFFAAFSSAGNLLWTRAIGGTGDDFAIALAPGASASGLFTGSFSGDIELDGASFSSTDDDALLLKLNANGTVQWARTAGGAGFQVGSDVKVDASGNVFWAGEFETNAVPGVTNLNVFLAKYDDVGKRVWIRQLGDGGEAQLPRLALPPDGRIFCTAVYSGAYAIGGQSLPVGLSDVLITSLNGAGEWQWTRTFGGNELDVCTELLVDASGGSYLVGYFRGTMPVGNTNLTSAGNTDIFVVHCSHTGQLDGAASAGGSAPDLAFSGALGPSGELRLTGSFSATARFGTITVTSSDSLAKLFIATMSEPPRLQIASFPTHVLLSWPGHFTGFTLESKTELSASSWGPVSFSPVLLNGELVVTNSVSNARQFFRLRK